MYCNVWVFVTINTEDRQCHFGHVKDGRMVYSPAGEVAHRAFEWLYSLRANLQLGEWVVMPNHVHALIRVIGPELPMRGGIPQNPVGEAVALYKSRVVNRARKAGLPVKWQTGYYDIIITSDQSHENVVRYIQQNPQKWWEKYGNGSA